MKISRADFLKAFGIGCVAVPLIGGEPKPELAGKLVEVPKVEPISTDLTLPPPAKGTRAHVSLVFPDQTRWQFEMEVTFLQGPSYEVEKLDVTTHNDAYRRFIPGRHLFNPELQLRGVPVSAPKIY